jgi:hypothetical protein
MVLEVRKYVRRPFAVEAVEVTKDNLRDVARWCGGRVRTSGEEDPAHKGEKYIHVLVKNPLNDRQTRAYVGDWVLSAKAGFKVYTPKAFTSAFEAEVDRMMDVVTRMEERAERENTEDEDLVDEATGVPQTEFSHQAM